MVGVVTYAPRCMFDEPCGSCVLVAQPISFTLPENALIRWIARQGPVSQSNRSADLNSLDSFLSGHLQGVVCASAVETAEEQLQRIQNGCAAVRNTPGIR